MDGKIVIDVICDHIRQTNFFIADLTEINPNVLFELGYAIAKNKRIWTLIDRSITRAREDFKKGLSATNLRGMVEVDPRKDDLFCRMVKSKYTRTRTKRSRIDATETT